jgi:spore coat protein A
LPQSRRNFLQNATALALLTRSGIPLQEPMGSMQMGPARKPAKDGPPQTSPKPQPELHSLELAPFVDELPLPRRILAHPHTKTRITMREIHAKVHRDVPATRFWSYGETQLAPSIEVRAGKPIQIEWVNELPKKHFLPIDYTLHGCGHDVPEVRACVHVHGAKARSKDDGQPDDWFVPGKSRTCTYPLEQEAAALWYHDHAMGINRLNMYAGLMGMFLIRDEQEDRLNLPAGKYELPLTLYDRNFTADGQLLYPVSPDPAKPWVSEFYADATLVNGKIRPYADVEPRLYRLRLLNGANSRFFNLNLTRPPVDNTPASRNFPGHHTFQQIGSDQGLLAAPVPLTDLIFAPGERADLLVDFSPFAGQTIHLRNSAFEILEFRVAAAPPQPASLPTQLRTMPISKPDPTRASVTRTITLNEYKDGVGNSMAMLLNRKHWHEPVTETPKLNATEIWEFVNLTEDTHPMHLHLVRFQLLDRRTFDTFDYLMHKKLRFLAGATAPEPNETGWKDVIQCPSGQITRILVTFDGFPGRYLYHCHILEHEANDMMRPFEVIA